MVSPTLPFRTSLTGIVWPAIVQPAGATLLALLFQLEHSQWLPADRLAEKQFEQLTALAGFLWVESPFHRERLALAGWSPGHSLDAGLWSRLPLLERATVQTRRAELTIDKALTLHGRPLEYSTNGSLGMPLRGLGNELTHLFASALVMRNHLWQRRDFSAKFAAIRERMGSQSYPNWGPIESSAFDTGPGVLLDSSTAIDGQLDWLAAEQPAYLHTYPSNLRGLLLRAHERRLHLPALREISTLGEILPDDLRALAKEVWRVSIADTYSSQELGNIALQCPEYPGCYHVQAENLLVEIIGDDGRRCMPGEIGRVVVSTLHNFTMPLWRYAIGDYAEVGEACPCGRGLPVLRRIVGRVRNMLRLPDGSSHWPSFPYTDLQPFANFRQIQIVQHSLREIEVRLSACPPLSAEREAAFSERLNRVLRGQFVFRYAYPDTIPPSPGGKFEDFISLVDVPS